MILSNTSIHEAIDQGRLLITPEPLPRTKTGGGPCPYQTSSVDLRLGNEVSWFKDIPASVDFRRGGFADLFGPNSESRTITQDQPYTLSRNKLVLAKTLEHIELPIMQSGSSLAARVEGKSSFARCGLLVHFTAPTIHSGFKGTITLELINFGPLDILLYPGMPICQLIVEQVDGVPFRNDSQFQGQSRAGGKV
jgi:dCTP deaminase